MINWMWQNITIMAMVQSWFGQALASTENWLVRYWKRNIDGIEVLQWESWSVCEAIRWFYRSRVYSNARPHRAHVCNAYLWRETIVFMDWPTRLPDLNPIEHAWDETFFRVRFQPDLCNPEFYRGSRMHWLLKGGWFQKTGYRLWLRACARDVVLKLILADVIRIIR